MVIGIPLYPYNFATVLMKEVLFSGFLETERAAVKLIGREQPLPIRVWLFLNSGSEG